MRSGRNQNLRKPEESVELGGAMIAASRPPPPEAGRTLAIERRNRKRRAFWGTVVIYRFELAPDDVHVGIVEDVDSAGLFIAMREPPPEGTLLNLCIYTQAGPPGRSVVRVSGVIRWRRLAPESAGAGVQFLQFADGEQGRDAWLELLATATPARASRLPPDPPLPVIEPPGVFELRPAIW